MTPDPDRKPTPEEMRTGGRLAMIVLLVLAVLTVVFVALG